MRTTSTHIASNPIYLCMCKLMKTQASGHQIVRTLRQASGQRETWAGVPRPELHFITRLWLRCQFLWALPLSWCSLMLDSTSRAGTGAKKPEMNRPAGTQPHTNTCKMLRVQQDGHQLGDGAPATVPWAKNPGYIFWLSMEASTSN